MFSGSVIARVGDGLLGARARGLPKVASGPDSTTSSPAFGIAFLRVFGERKKGRGERGVSGDGKGDVAWED